MCSDGKERRYYSQHHERDGKHNIGKVCVCIDNKNVSVSGRIMNGVFYPGGKYKDLWSANA